MIGKLTITNVGMRCRDGYTYIIARIAPKSRFNVKPILQDVKRSDKEITIEFAEQKTKRTLDQNALYWKLLTLYADALGGGTTPEDMHYQTLNRYGAAQFVTVANEAVEPLKRLYRYIKIVDDAVIMCDGKRTPAKTVKCIIGSSKYDTKEMSKVINGIFDELAQLDIDVGMSRQAVEYREEWNKICK